jgi:hypothetical protein
MNEFRGIFEIIEQRDSVAPETILSSGRSRNAG